jgi:hypothetical protein
MTSQFVGLTGGQGVGETHGEGDGMQVEYAPTSFAWNPNVGHGAHPALGGARVPAGQAGVAVGVTVGVGVGVGVRVGDGEGVSVGDSVGVGESVAALSALSPVAAPMCGVCQATKPPTMMMNSATGNAKRRTAITVRPPSAMSAN